MPDVTPLTPLQKQMREAAAAQPAWNVTEALTTGADAAYAVVEPLTATHRLKEAGIDLARLTAVLDSRENWGHLVHAFEVLAVLGAVKQEMEALDAPTDA